MNARIIKETRSLLPVFAVMLLGVVCPPLIWGREAASAVGTCVFVACVAIMAASHFGNEFQWRTLSLLLAQPMSRRKLWLEKMLVLAVALALGFIVFLACTYIPSTNNDDASRLAMALIPLCALCSAPFVTLSIKNTIGAAAVIVVLPLSGVLLLTGLEQGLAHFFPWIGELVENAYKEHEVAYVGAYALVYCALSVWLGYSMFMNLQVVESQARDIALPAGVETALARPLRRLVPGYTGPWASLLRKELQLQRVSFIIAVFMLALAPLQLVLWKLFHSEIAVGSLGINFVMCIFVIPLVATGMSVAEERNLGVAGWQFIQPVSARKQWTAKILIVLFVCVTLGVLLPVAGILIGQEFFHLQGFNFDAVLNSGTPAETLVNMVLPVVFYLLLLSLGLFASSISKTTLQAVIFSIGLIALSLSVTALIVDVSERIARVNYHDWFQYSGHLTQAQADLVNRFNDEMNLKRTVLHFYIEPVGWSLLALLLGAVFLLAYGNYRKGEQASNAGRIKLTVPLIIISGVVIALATTTSWSVASMLARIFVKPPF